MSIIISPFNGSFAEDIGPFISAIQRDEFHIPITLADQPDLANIAAAYQQNNGNFWVASTASMPLGSSSLRHEQNPSPLGSTSLRHEQKKQLVGTIALIDAGGGLGIIRKMFVAKPYRGAPHYLARQLLKTLENWASLQGFTQVYLGTTEVLIAAQKFYQKHEFNRITKESLPPAVHALSMAVDTLYYTKKVTAHAHVA